ncbi:MAG: glycerophosphodiester phosphodiesterase [Deltaproteobacteria bacterium]|nr:MAG: glycerophosphodiester phosphodiesterase [Deltaproteobacteria bacterium]
MSRLRAIARSLGSRHAPRSLAPLLPSGVILGHRGASAHAPENTLAAFERCAGAELGFEFDVSTTADGQLVVLHDDTIDRTTTGRGEIRDLVWPAVRDLSAGSWFSPDFQEARIPLLDDVLSRYAGRVPLNVELKSDPAPLRLAERVIERLRTYAALDRVLLSSFDPFVLGAIADLEPGVLRGQIVGRLDDAELGRIARRALRGMWFNGISRPDVICAELAIAEELLSTLVPRGVPVLVWTVNDPDRARHLRERGAWGFISDDPERLAAALG